MDWLCRSGCITPLTAAELEVQENESEFQGKAGVGGGGEREARDWVSFLPK